MASCSRGSDDAPRPEHPGEGGQRPDGPQTEAGAWLRDAAWRYRGPSSGLDYRRGGVLIRNNADGSLSMVDLDEGGSVRIAATGMRRDSVMGGATLRVDGREVALRYMRLARETAEAAWIEAADEGGGMHFLVIPPHEE